MAKRPLAVFERIRKENPEKYQEMMVDLYETQRVLGGLKKGVRKSVQEGYERLKTFVENIEPETRKRLTAASRKKMADLKKAAAPKKKKI